MCFQEDGRQKISKSQKGETHTFFFVKKNFQSNKKKVQTSGKLEKKLGGCKLKYFFFLLIERTADENHFFLFV